MKCKLVFTVVGLFIFLFCFTTSLLVRDYLYEQTLKSNIHKVKIGMTDKEVVEILGKASNKDGSDISPGAYWFYDTSSVSQFLDDNPDRLGHLV